MKRFYKLVESELSGENYVVLLDGKIVKTPAGNNLLLPSAQAAQLVVKEFAMQKDIINPESMPVTRIVNTVLDGIVNDPQAIVEDVLRMVAHDLLFYRVREPQALAMRQSECWDGLLDKVYELTNAHFNITYEMLHVVQPAESMQLLGVFLRRFNMPFALGSLHVMASLTGSVLTALLVAVKKISLEQAWEAVHLEQDWCSEFWGQDEEILKIKAQNFNQVQAAYELLQSLNLN